MPSAAEVVAGVQVSQRPIAIQKSILGARVCLSPARDLPTRIDAGSFTVRNAGERTDVSKHTITVEVGSTIIKLPHHLSAIVYGSCVRRKGCR